MEPYLPEEALLSLARELSRLSDANIGRKINVYTANFNNFVFERAPTHDNDDDDDVGRRRRRLVTSNPPFNRFLFRRHSHGFIQPQFNKSTALSLMRRIPSEFDKRAAPRVLRE